jgi:hypothetical protein
VLGVHVAGGRAFLAIGREGIRIVDVADPLKPKSVGYMDTPRGAGSIHAWGSWVLVGDIEWLRLVDVTDPAAPREVASFKTAASTDDIWVADGVAYLAAQQAGLLTFSFEPRARQPVAPAAAAASPAGGD